MIPHEKAYCSRKIPKGCLEVDMWALLDYPEGLRQFLELIWRFEDA